MKVLEFRSVGALALIGLLVALSSCAHDQQLVSITIAPTEETFGDATIPLNLDAGLSVQLRAIGTYVHPPVTKDITSQVQWGSDDIQMVTVNPTGLITATGNACGSTLIAATVNTNRSTGNRSSSGAIVTANMTANVVCFHGTGNTLTVQFSGTGSGVIGSSPGGLGCTSTSTACSGTFVPGTVVTLTATPNPGSAFGAWLGCDSTVGNSCIVALFSNRTVAVTFN